MSPPRCSRRASARTSTAPCARSSMPVRRTRSTRHSPPSTTPDGSRNRTCQPRSSSGPTASARRGSSATASRSSCGSRRATISKGWRPSRWSRPCPTTSTASSSRCSPPTGWRAMTGSATAAPCWRCASASCCGAGRSTSAPPSAPSATASTSTTSAWWPGSTSRRRPTRSNASAGSSARSARRWAATTPLVIPVDESSAWAWIPSKQSLAKTKELDAATKGEPTVSLAVGEPAKGIDGFRRSHDQAVSARGVALAAGDQRSARHALRRRRTDRHAVRRPRLGPGLDPRDAR